MKTAVLVAAFAAGALAIPAASAVATKKCYLDDVRKEVPISDAAITRSLTSTQFDSITTGTAGALIPNLAPITAPINGLSYSYFTSFVRPQAPLSFLPPDLTMLQCPGPGTGFTPKSGRCTIDANVLNANKGSLTPQGLIKPATGVKTFDLGYFYFACGDATVTPDVVAGVGWVLSVTGHNTTSQVPEATFAFGNLQNPTEMALAKLPVEYVGLVEVTIAVVSSAVNVAQTNLFIDNVYHCNNA